MSDSLPLPKKAWPELRAGWVWLCGAGPGDPGLLTLHGLNALRQADVVVYDALVGEDILSWAGDAELIYAGKRGRQAFGQTARYLVAFGGAGPRGKTRAATQGGGFPSSLVAAARKHKPWCSMGCPSVSFRAFQPVSAGWHMREFP